MELKQPFPLFQGGWCTAEIEILALHWFHRTEEALESTKAYFNKWYDSCLKNQAIFITGFFPKSLPPLQFPMIFSADNLCTSPPQWLMLSTSWELQSPVGHIQWGTPAALHVPRNNAVTKQACGWSQGTAVPCWGSSRKEIKVPRGARWAAFLKRAEDTLKCVLVCLCESVLVLGLRGRGYKTWAECMDFSVWMCHIFLHLKTKATLNSFQQRTTHFQAFHCTRQQPQSIQKYTLSF